MQAVFAFRPAPPKEPAGGDTRHHHRRGGARGQPVHVAELGVPRGAPLRVQENPPAGLADTASPRDGCRVSDQGSAEHARECPWLPLCGALAVRVFHVQARRPWEAGRGIPATALANLSRGPACAAHSLADWRGCPPPSSSRRRAGATWLRVRTGFLRGCKGHPRPAGEAMHVGRPPARAGDPDGDTRHHHRRGGGRGQLSTWPSGGVSRGAPLRVLEKPHAGLADTATPRDDGRVSNLERRGEQGAVGARAGRRAPFGYTSIV